MECIPSSHLDCAFDKVQTPPLLKSNCVSKKKIKHGITNPLSLSLSLSLSPPPTPPPNTAVPHPQGYKSCRPGGCFFCYKQFKVKTDKCIMYYVLLEVVPIRILLKCYEHGMRDGFFLDTQMGIGVQLKFFVEKTDNKV